MSDKNSELGKKLETLASNHYGHINSAIDSPCGLENWYKAYIQSPSYDRLPPELKLEAFNTYQGINKYLQSVFEVVDEED